MLRQNNSKVSTAYTRGAKVLHWSIAILVILMIIHGWTLDDQQGAELSQSLGYHAFGGIMVFSLVMLRISWRIGYPPPPLPGTLTKRQKIAAHSVHISLYITMFLVPLTGFLAGIAHETPIIVADSIDIQRIFSFIGRDDFDLKREIHAQTMHILVALTIGHIGAALVHQFWLKDNLMSRMLSDERRLQS